MALITDPDQLADSATDDNSEEVYIDTAAQQIKLVVVGNLSTDGVTLKALYSFLKEEWRNDPNTKNLAAFPFPMVPITDEFFEFVEGWDFLNDTGRNLIRNGGWLVRNVSGNVTAHYAGLKTTGTTESNDQLYYQLDGDSGVGSPTNFVLTGPANQAVQIISDPNGDGNYADGFSRADNVKVFNRESAQIYSLSSTVLNGEASLEAPKVFGLDASTGIDLKVQATDGLVALSVAVSTASWAAGVATFQTGSAHGLSTGDYVIISGVTPVGYNVRGTVTVVDTDEFQVAIAVDPTAYTSGGTVKTIYSEIVVRYFDQAFSRDVDSGTDRNFGIVVDVGTHSGVDGSTAAAGSVLTSSEGGIDGAKYAGGTLVIHEGANAGTYTISGTPTATQVTVTGTFSNTLGNQSFTLYPAVEYPATAEQIYTKIQYLLRQNSDIDSTDGSVTGKTADQIMHFVGDTLVCGRSPSGVAPTNPNGGGSGVIIEGFLAADTNRLTFYDNTATARTYPFVAVLTINFGPNLVDDPDAVYWVYFTTLPGAGNDFGEAGALLVEDNGGVDMAGPVTGASIVHTFNYDGNSQGGRTPGEDAAVTIVGLGLATGQYVRATATIERSTTNSASLVAALERNYANP